MNIVKLACMFGFIVSAVLIFVTSLWFVAPAICLFVGYLYFGGFISSQWIMDVFGEEGKSSTSNTSRSEKLSDENSTSKSAEKNGDQEVSNILQGLINLTRYVRESALPSEIVLVFEQVVTDLFDLIPRLNADGIGGELPWVVNRMGSHYLPKVTNSFIGLSPEARLAGQAEMLESLGVLNRELEKVQRILNGHAEGNFDDSVKFLQVRFLQIEPLTQAKQKELA